MLQKVSHWLENNIESWKQKKYLLGVSGGVDSVVLTQVFKRLELNIEIAHCNFNLRGKEAEQDQAFVQELAEQLHIPFYTRSFKTQEHASINKVSIQEAARNLRYAWFEELRAENNFDYIVVGTHLSDQMETILINLIRGTGLAGLHGILGVRNSVIRPLIDITREEIIEYAQVQGFKWREDSSNKSEKYLRNNIRKNIIPAFKNIEPNIEKQFALNAERVLEAEQFLSAQLNNVARQIMVKKATEWLINKKLLASSGAPKLVLYHCVNKYGFSHGQCADAVDMLNNQPGGTIECNGYQLLNDRENLILSEIRITTNRIIKIDKELKPVENLHFETLPNVDLDFRQGAEVVFFDFDKLEFPLILRNWQQGDRIKPFGMKGSKKVSDILVDLKLSRNEKSKVRVLLSGNEIIWILGLRTSESFKISDRTKTVFKVTSK